MVALGKACGTSAGAIQAYERNERDPRLAMAVRLAAALQCELTDLLQPVAALRGKPSRA